MPKRRRQCCRDIRAVHEPSNLDEYPLVQLWGLRFGDDKLRWDPTIDVDCAIGIDRRIRQDGCP
jgi:hypothetical protein